MDGAHHGLVRLGAHLVVEGVGDGAAAGQGHQAGAAAGAQPPVHGVQVQVGAAPPAAGGEAFGQHPYHGVEAVAGQAAVGVRPAHDRIQLVGRPLARRALGDDLLRQDVERRVRDRDLVQVPPRRCREQRAPFHQVVAAEREEPALGRGADRVAGAADALQKGHDGARRAELAHQVHGADVDAQLQRRGGDQGAQRSLLEPPLRVQARLLGQTAVVGGHRVRAQALAQLVRGALGHAPRVDEDQRRAVRVDELAQAGVDLLPHLVGHHRRQGRAGQLQRRVHAAAVADVHDRARIARRHQVLGHALDRLLRRRQADAAGRRFGERLQPLQAEGEVGAALGADHGVDLVDDHGLHGAQHPAAAVGGEQQVQRLRSGHQDVRRAAGHRRARRGGGVAGADQRADRRGTLLSVRRLRMEQAVDAGQRLLQVAVDVVAERLQGRDVQDRGRFGQRPADRAAHQSVDRGQKGGERLARTGGSGDQRVPAAGDLGPGALLDFRGSGEGVAKPGGDRGMEPLQWIGMPGVSMPGVSMPRINRVGAVHGIRHVVRETQRPPRARGSPPT